MFEYENLKGCVKPYIIAELGSNHNGDMELAKNMIAKAKECGADCIKLQTANLGQKMYYFPEKYMKIIIS